VSPGSARNGAYLWRSVADDTLNHHQESVLLFPGPSRQQE
jgi:hypothetical protein